MVPGEIPPGRSPSGGSIPGRSTETRIMCIAPPPFDTLINDTNIQTMERDGCSTHTRIYGHFQCQKSISAVQLGGWWEVDASWCATSMRRRSWLVSSARYLLILGGGTGL